MGETDNQTAAEQFAKGIDCSQVVLAHFAEKLGLDRAEANRMAAAFGGGMGAGETCGAVAGAMIAIGLRYGHSRKDDAQQKSVMNAKRAELLSRFREKYGCCACRDLLGHDIALPGEFEKVLEEGLLFDFCPVVVLDAVDMLDGIL